jgi:hypothetical protein
MQIKSFLFAVSVGALLAVPASSTAASAQDATFACTVLLCSLASAPGWSAIPTCVPPMTQALTTIAHGGSWPVCPQAPIEDAGSQPYTCPSGAQNVSLVVQNPTSDVRGNSTPANNGSPQYVPDANGALCAAPTAADPTGACQSTAAALNPTFAGEPQAIPGGCLTVTSANPNPTPDYVDFALPNQATGASTTRFWYNAAPYN